MQLILDLEPTTDIKRNMSNLDQESLIEKLDNVIQDLKDGFCNNGNKENIQTQGNVIVDDDKSNGNNIVLTQSPLSNDSTDTKDVSQIAEEKSSIMDDKLENEEESKSVITKENNDSNSESNEILLEKETKIHANEKENLVINETLEDKPVEHVNKEQVVNNSENYESTNIELDDANVIERCPAEDNVPIVDEQLNNSQNEQITKNDSNDELSPEDKVNKIVSDDEKLPEVEDVDVTIDKEMAVILKEHETNKEIPSDDYEVSKIASDSSKIMEGNTVEANPSSIEKLEDTVTNQIDNEKNNKILSKSKDNLIVLDDKKNIEQKWLGENRTNVDKKVECELKEHINNKSRDKISLDSNKENKIELEGEKQIERENTEGSESIKTVTTNCENPEKQNDSYMEIDSENENDNKIASDEKRNEEFVMEINNVLSTQTCDKDIEVICTDKRKQSMENVEIKNNSIKKKQLNDVSDTEIEESNIVSNLGQDTSNVDEIDLVKTPEPTIIKKQREPMEETSTRSSILKLSNTLNILSDEEDDPPEITEQNNIGGISTEKQCINIDDDDDIMLIDEDINSKEIKNETIKPAIIMAQVKVNSDFHDTLNKSELEKTCSSETIITEHEPIENLEEKKTEDISQQQGSEKTSNITEVVDNPDEDKPLVPDNFLKSYKKSLSDMTREDLEEFCVLKIVESIVDRSNLSEIKVKLKSLAQNVEEYKKKAMMLTKQNRDLQLVLKSVQEEQKKREDTVITPLKITRSVGMQVLMTEKPGIKRKPLPSSAATPNNSNSPNTRSSRPPGLSPRTIKPIPPLQIPVPRLVPASNSTVMKTPVPISQGTSKVPVPPLNGIKNSPPAQKAEKRPHNKVQMSVTVDLTDDEPPSKIPTRNSPAPPVRLVPSQNLMAPQRQQLSQNTPRKVYIPISGPQGNLRPGQTIMLKSAPTQNLRPRTPTPQLARMPHNQVRMSRVQSKHPAPLPDAMKQYQPPHWKSLPPAPDLKLSKVENGIVISWKIEGYLEDSYEDIASYQLYAYQETSSPPSSALWKKIGDVKALPLPMACTLTQFMAGFKYYFAVRAVDIRSRLGPFSIPGSILLLNKM
ncbi:activating transcription factor 7-interacting protein 1 [Achroia grisella]|uniref:activating transcription factor 7-interacting protein 1 n=1 Tax=Achroia grisella TaxID=688607 RepID=UPI0027D22EB7|nr:activating transcription factor 7-interacting protein 1 [Achroia grisella]XP_059046172.1 activating transcription factor 7-interacting protein 1 [Achroia grisella]XP_059046173.1 activating transcription factor 7-interacting protein 1 [Achroia grisella]